MKILDKKVQLLVHIIILSLFISIISTSYAYFITTANSNAKENKVTTGSMEISFEDGSSIKASNILPGQTITKTFSVKNVGSLSTNYNVYFSDLINTFTDKDDLVYSVSSSNGCNKEFAVMPSYSDDSSKAVDTCLINKGETHEYTLTIKFLEDNINQDDNKGKIFTSYLSLNEYSTIAYDDAGISNEVLWTYSNNKKTLKIFGSGDMEDYSLDNLPPWYQYKDSITNIEVGEDVTKLGTYAFYNLSFVDNLRLDCQYLNNLKHNSDNGNIGNNYTLYRLGNDTQGATIIFGKKATRVPRYLMEPTTQDKTVTNVTNLVFEGNNIKEVENYGLAFFKGSTLILPEGITYSLGMAFAFNDSYLAILPNSQTRTDHFAFNGSTKLEKVVYGPVTSAIYEYSYAGCNNIKELVIPHINNPTAYNAVINPSNTAIVYGDDSTQKWVNNCKEKYSYEKLEYKPLSEYKSNITSDIGISGSVGYNESFTFQSDLDLEFKYTYTNNDGNTITSDKVSVEKEGNTYTIKNIRQDIYITAKYSN